MAYKIKQLPQASGWFKPDEFKVAKALFVTVNDVERDRPTDFGPKDSVIADIAVFATASDLKKGPSEEYFDIRVEHTALANALINQVGNSFIVTVEKGQAKPGRQAPWLWSTVEDSAVVNAVIAWAEQADDNAPPF